MATIKSTTLLSKSVKNSIATTSFAASSSSSSSSSTPLSSSLNDLLVEINLDDYKNSKIFVKYMNSLKESQINQNKFKISMAFIVKNKTIEQKFNQKVKEMSNSNGKCPQLKYAFTITSTYERMIQTCQCSVECNNSDFNCLGPSKKGVYMCLHPDVMLEFVKYEYTFLIMHKIAISRTRKFDVDLNQAGPEPNSNLHDYHTSKTTVNKNMNLNAMYKNSVIYLFDYDYSNKKYHKFPRQVMPVAVFLIKKQLVTVNSDKKFTSTISSPVSNMKKISLFNNIEQPQSPMSPTKVLIKKQLSQVATSKDSIISKVASETQTDIVETIEVYVQTEQYESINNSNSNKIRTNSAENNDNCVDNAQYIVNNVKNDQEKIESELDVMMPIEEEEEEEEEDDEVIDEVIISNNICDDLNEKQNESTTEVTINMAVKSSASNTPTRQFYDDDDALPSPLPDLNSPEVEHDTSKKCEEIKKPKKKIVILNNKLLKLKNQLVKKAIKFKFKKFKYLKPLKCSSPLKNIIENESNKLYNPFENKDDHEEHEDEKDNDSFMLDNNHNSKLYSSLSSLSYSTLPESPSSVQIVDEDNEVNENESLVIPVSTTITETTSTTRIVVLTDNRILRAYWDSIYFIFKFLLTGQLNIKDALNEINLIDNMHDASLSNEIERFRNSYIHTTNLINPIDPTDHQHVTWQWNLRSIKQYKLIKLKYNLITRIKELSDYYIQNSLNLVSSNLSGLNETMGTKLDIINRLDEYVNRWKACLEDLLQRSKIERIGNDESILSVDEFLMRKSSKQTCENSYFSNGNQVIELTNESFCEKLSFLLDILVINDDKNEIELFYERMNSKYRDKFNILPSLLVYPTFGIEMTSKFNANGKMINNNSNNVSSNSSISRGTDANSSNNGGGFNGDSNRKQQKQKNRRNESRNRQKYSRGNRTKNRSFNLKNSKNNGNASYNDSSSSYKYRNVRSNDGKMNGKRRRSYSRPRSSNSYHSNSFRSPAFKRTKF